MALTPLQLNCFGSPTARLVAADSPDLLRWRKNIALLVYLALSPGYRRSRDHLLNLLWGEQPERSARKALNMTLSRLRAALGEGRLRSQGDAIELSDDGLDVDVARLVADTETAPETMLPLLRGEFLEGFHLRGAPEFEDWMSAQRLRYSALAVRALVRAGERLLAQHAGRAADCARHALAFDPRNEPAVQLLMHAATLTGDAAAALEAYHAFRTRLKREVGEEPSKALAQFADRIRKGAWRRASSDGEKVPLVGRSDLHQHVFDAAGELLMRGASGRTLVITGAPGMGRTRLLAECGHRLALGGAVVVHGRPLSTDHDAPWSTLRALLRGGLGEAPGIAGARPDALSALAWLTPELGVRYPPRETRDVSDVASALAAAIRAVSDESPLALVIDDAQWADGMSITALGAAVADLKDSPVLLLLGITQDSGDMPRELRQLQSKVGHDVPGLAVRLTPLVAADLEALVSALAPWCRSAEDRGRLTRRIARESGGSPLFAVTLLIALRRASTFRRDMMSWPARGRTTIDPWPLSIPSAVKHAMALRLGELRAGAIGLLCAAAVSGDVFDVPVIQKISGLSRRQVERALRECERRQVIQFDGQRYAFVAPLVAAVVRAECMTPGERRKLEEKALAAIAGATDLHSRIVRIELAARVMPSETTLTEALALVKEAEGVGAPRMAARASAAAERARTHLA